MEQLNSAFTLFLSLLVEAMPFLLLGVVLSGLLLFFVDEQKLIKLAPQNPILGAFAGSCIGFLFPVCECGNVPVARRLIMQGVPLPVAVGFLLAAPVINPIVIWSTWIAFRDQPEIVWLRVLFSLLIATVVGYVFGQKADLKALLQPATVLGTIKKRPAVDPQISPLLQSGTFMLGGPVGAAQRLEDQMAADLIRPQLKVRERFNLLLENTLQELRELGGILILGSAIAAIIQTFTPRELILGLGQGSVSSIAAMMLLAGLISICSTVDAFFALSFAGAFTSGSLLAFLVFGPMFDLKGIGLLLSVFKPKAIFYLFALAAQLTFLLTLFVNFIAS
jgi:uncharacterized membrane protein YraQ (UPF0718 family)